MSREEPILRQDGPWGGGRHEGVRMRMAYLGVGNSPVPAPSLHDRKSGGERLVCTGTFS